jgi:hypothetical protein
MFALPTGCALRYNNRTKKRTKPDVVVIRWVAQLALAMLRL